MKAALYQGKESVEMTELETPHPEENDIVVKNIYASICGTDVAVYQHGPGTRHRINVGGEFGHEMVSQVVEVGKNVQDIKVGDRVYPYPRLAKGDTKRAGTVGGFSEYVLIPDAKWNQQIYAVSDKISDKEASLIEPFTVGCRAARHSQPKKGENAVVICRKMSMMLWQLWRVENGILNPLLRMNLHGRTCQRQSKLRRMWSIR